MTTGTEAGAGSTGSEPPAPTASWTVRSGAILLAAGSAVYVLAMILCQWAYPGYSVLNQAMSDLGNTSNSTLWYLFSAGLATLGLSWAIGSVSISGAMRAGVSRSVGLGLLAAAGLGAVVIAAAPEDLQPAVHFGAAMVFLPGGALGLLVLGAGAMPRTSHWGRFGYVTLLLGAIALAAFALLISKSWGPLGLGGAERLSLGPVLLWTFLAAVHLLALPSPEATAPSTKRPSVASPAVGAAVRPP